MPEPFILKQRYLHLMPVEKVLWERWMSQFRDAWSGYEYDVHVGEGMDYGGAEAPWVQDLVRLLTQKRIDVIAYRQGVPWIFEVKPGAAVSAYGQLLGYRELYRRQFRYEGPIELAVVTDFLGPDDRFLFEGAGIHIFLV